LIVAVQARPLVIDRPETVSAAAAGIVGQPLVREQLPAARREVLAPLGLVGGPIGGRHLVPGKHGESARAQKNREHQQN
jgi:hypothetical protein